MRLKFWSRTLRINPRKLVKANFWFALILKPILGIMAILTLLAVWGVSVDIMLNKVRNFQVGFNIGRTTRKKVCTGLPPSMTAASSMERGMDLTKPVNMNTARPAPKPR